MEMVINLHKWVRVAIPWSAGAGECSECSRARRASCSWISAACSVRRAKDLEVGLGW